MAPKVCRKTDEDLFLEVTPKKGLHDLFGRKFVSKIAQKSFSGKNLSHTQNFTSSYTCDENAPPPPLPTFERAEGKSSAMPPFSAVRVHIILAYWLL